MSYVARKFFVLPADREEVKKGISMFMLARADALAAMLDVEAFGASGMYFVGGKGWALCFKKPGPHRVEGLSRLFFVKEVDGWVALPDKRKSAGKKIDALLQDAADLQEIWQWSLEKSLGIYGVVSCGYPVAFHYCVAKPLADGRVIVATPDAKNHPKGNGRSRNFEDPVIPSWAVEISADEYSALEALPEMGEQIVKAD